jgi:hypothetical protein
VGLANWPMLAAYRLLPRMFDVLVGPLMRTASFAKDALEATAGNAFTQVDRRSPQP